jgi:membrane protease YdiL (CAAX protease family)
VNVLVSVFHITLAILIYLLVAAGTAVLIRKTGGNLKDMAGRTSTSVLLLSGAANLLILILTLALVIGFDKEPLSALGLSFSVRDGLFALVGAAVTLLLAIAFVRLRERGPVPSITQSPAAKAIGTRRMIVGWVVLLVVAIQEEMLYRGYITLNLFGLSPAWILVFTTAIFVLIHFMTNRIGKYQIVSWTVSGLVLGGAYLVSGSIWVPIILHLATDMTNVLVFHITGQPTISKAIPTFSVKDRATFRLLYGLVVVLLLAAFYQTAVFASPPIGEGYNGSLRITQVQVSRGQISVVGQSTLPEDACIHTTLLLSGQPVSWWPAETCAAISDGYWRATVQLGQDGVPAKLDATSDYTATAQTVDKGAIQSSPFVFDLTGPPRP